MSKKITEEKLGRSKKSNSTGKNVGEIMRVSGPVVYAKMRAAVNDLVKVGNTGLMGEVIQLEGSTSVIQVYEDTIGLMPGEKVVNTKKSLSVALGPGILGGVFDGTQRPLDVIASKYGVFVPRGVDIPSLDMDKKWEFKAKVKIGAVVKSGEIIGEVKENPIITHKIMVPNGIFGKVEKISSGAFTNKDIIAKIGGKEITMVQHWPVRVPRPVEEKQGVHRPLISGQRILDFFAPVAKGGVAAIPGPFGSGKTVTQQQLAKWCDADIIIYVGCGERGNEMTEVLSEFPHLKDPKSGQPLMNRTVLIANTSNMPVAAREACVYTGITIAEYFRDMGYNVALMADSTSRWAEAMREISGRLEEMPGEEGYPAYLSKRLAEFYERAGYVKNLSGGEGSITVVGAVSPPGGDFSEPVTQNTLRLAKCFWALDANLANKRHYPAINWLRSYSLYNRITDKWYNENVSSDWGEMRKRCHKLLQEEAELQEIVQLVGVDSLPKDQQLLLFAARLVREDFLQQNAFHEDDTFCPLEKQASMIRLIFGFYDTAKEVIEDLDLDKLRESSGVQELAQLKYRQNDTFMDGKHEAVEKEVMKLIEKSLR
ncbi:V-type ATP synthase subunit A [archaeon]|jgi:V/A-type H+/Na+-transporting ATPase subunit A|nr:V-type ATP synthase subunit A [archaeon]MBT6697857.1 V-type ATP synthase subunit A [archaeon]